MGSSHGSGGDRSCRSNAWRCWTLRCGRAGATNRRVHSARTRVKDVCAGA